MAVTRKGAIGLVTFLTGVTVIAGSITGNLAAMLAALFAPSILVPASNKSFGTDIPLVVPPFNEPDAETKGGQPLEDPSGEGSSSGGLGSGSSGGELGNGNGGGGEIGPGELGELGVI